MKTLIIAEAGVNHNGEIDIALELVRRAAEAGADLVKFQTFQTGRSIARHAPKADYQKQTTGAAESQYEMVRQLELSLDDHRRLLEECRRCGIGFFSTAFDRDSHDLLIGLGIDRVKIPSGELTNLPLLRHMTREGLPVILSTGMATLGEVEAALGVIEMNGIPREKITILHCTTEYPAPMAEVNLRAMLTLSAAFGTTVGYSDHTEGIEIPIAAVALGATIIEKHFTLDRSMPGPDHRASIDPGQLTAMVSAIRNIEVALGNGLKVPTASELKNKLIARKSIVAARNIGVGEVFDEANLDTKRPGTGLSPMLWDEVIGRVAKRDFDEDELIEL
jgi:N,N'-diacetyllegionaminate synthase